MSIATKCTCGVSPYYCIGGEHCKMNIPFELMQFPGIKGSQINPVEAEEAIRQLQRIKYNITMRQFAVCLFFRKTEEIANNKHIQERMYLKVYEAENAHEAFGICYNEVALTEFKGFDLVFKTTVPVPEIKNCGMDFKSMRQKKGLTLREVETATGISNAYLSQLETGKIKKPSHDTVTKLVQFYNS